MVRNLPAYAVITIVLCACTASAVAQADSLYRGEDDNGKAIIDAHANGLYELARQTAPHAIAGLAGQEKTIAAAPPNGLSLATVESSNFPFVYVYVRAYQDGMPITALPQSAFTVYENGAQQLQYFAVTPPYSGEGIRAVDMVFLIDDSGSMWPYIEAVLNNVRSFVDSMTAEGIDTMLGLVRFGAFHNSGEPELLNNGELMDDVSQFRTLLNTFTASGAIEPSLRAIEDAATGFDFRPFSQRHFLVITNEGSNGPPNGEGGDLSDSINACVSNNIVVHAAVDLTWQDGNTQQVYIDDTGIRGQTGGLLFDVADNYDELLDEIQNVVSDSYIVKYRSSTPEPDGTARAGRVVIDDASISGEVPFTYIAGATPTIRFTADTRFKISSGVDPNQVVELTFEVIDNYDPGTESVSLYVRTIGGADFKRVNCTQVDDSNIWSGRVGASVVASSGFEFFVTATDGQSSRRLPSEQAREYPYAVRTKTNYTSGGVVHYSPEVVHPGQDLTLEVGVLPWTRAINSISLFYRAPGGVWQDPITMAYDDQAEGLYAGTFRATVPGDSIRGDGLEYYFLISDSTSQFTLGMRDWPYRLAPVESWTLQAQLRLLNQACQAHLHSIADTMADALAQVAVARQSSFSNSFWDQAYWLAALANLHVQVPAGEVYDTPPGGVQDAVNTLIEREYLGAMQSLMPTVRFEQFFNEARTSDHADHTMRWYSSNPQHWQHTRQWFAELMIDATRYRFPGDDDQQRHVSAKNYFLRKILRDMHTVDFYGNAYQGGINGLVQRIAAAYVDVEPGLTAMDVSSGLAEAVAFTRFQQECITNAADSSVYGFTLDNGRLVPDMELGGITQAADTLVQALEQLKKARHIQRGNTLTDNVLTGGRLMGFVLNGSVDGSIAVPYWGATIDEGSYPATAAMGNQYQIGVCIHQLTEAFMAEMANLSTLVADTYANSLPAILADPSLAPLPDNFVVGNLAAAYDAPCADTTAPSDCPRTVNLSTTVQSFADAAVPTTTVFRVRPVKHPLLSMPVFSMPTDIVANYVELDAGQPHTVNVTIPLPDQQFGGTEVSSTVYAGIMPYIPAADVLTARSAETDGLEAVLKQDLETTDLTDSAAVVLCDAQVYRTTFTPRTMTAELKLRYGGSAFDLHIYDAAGNHTGWDYAAGVYEEGITGVTMTSNTTNERSVLFTESMGQSFTIEVFARHAIIPEHVVISAVHYDDDAPATIAAVPAEVTMYAQDGGTLDAGGRNVISAPIRVREISGNQYAAVSFVAGALTDADSGAVIPAENVAIDLANYTIPSGSSVRGELTVAVPSSTPPGTYHGTVMIVGPGNSYPMAVTVVWQPVTLHTTIEGQGTVRLMVRDDMPTELDNSIGMDGPYFVKGITIRLVASPAANWQFANWQGDTQAATTLASLILDGDKGVTAGFTALPEAPDDPTLTGLSIDGPTTLAADGNGAYTVTAAYSDGTSQDVTAQAQITLTSGGAYCSLDGATLTNSNTSGAEQVAGLQAAYSDNGTEQQATIDVMLQAAGTGSSAVSCLPFGMITSIGLMAGLAVIGRRR